MGFQFASCDRSRALGFIRKSGDELKDLQDDPETTGDFLDLIEADVVRILDPDFHPKGSVVMGKNFKQEDVGRIKESLVKAGIAHAETA